MATSPRAELPAHPLLADGQLLAPAKTIVTFGSSVVASVFGSTDVVPVTINTNTILLMSLVMLSLRRRF